MEKQYTVKSGEKKEQLRFMFNNIAGKYDFLNHLLSFGIDKCWRRKVVKRIVTESPKSILDVATGTADLALALSKRTDSPITGIDIAKQMLAIGEEKIRKKNLEHQISLLPGDSEALPFEDGSFDVAMVAFGVRNFENLHKGLSEMQRVLLKGGLIAVLEFSRPKHFPVKQLYNFYFTHILPKLGGWVSKDKSAYKYLPESVGTFPDGEDFLDELRKAGFSKTSKRKLTFGIATFYTAYKL